jgi:hypothetical protein
MSQRSLSAGRKNPSRRKHDPPEPRALPDATLKPGYRPDFPLPGTWLYANDEPVVHLILASGGSVDRRSETIDHVGFRLRCYDDYRHKLEALGVSYSKMELPELGARCLFVRTPTGILLELVFRESDAASNSQRSDRVDREVREEGAAC